MKEGSEFIILLVICAIILIAVSFIGNKIWDKGANARNKKKVEQASKTENLADRFKKDEK